MFFFAVLGFNETSTFVGHFVLPPREREKRDRRDNRRDERERQGRKTINESEDRQEICQYDIDAPHPGAHSHPHTGILQKMKLKKGHNSHNNWRILP